MTARTLALDVADGIATITLARPELGNPIDGEFSRDLYEMANALAGRDDVRAILLRADGPAFSYGGDISTFAPQVDELPAIMRRWTGDFHTGLIRLQRLDAPIVAQVQGVCAGGGVAIAAGADFVIGTPTTRFVAAYTGIGLACDGGASLACTRRMGFSRATRFMLLNQSLTGAQALEAGLMDEMLEPEALAPRAQALARQLADGPTVALGEVRRLLRQATHATMEAQLEAEAQAMVKAATTEDAREGVLAFAEKRKPSFRGR